MSLFIVWTLLDRLKQLFTKKKNKANKPDCFQGFLGLLLHLVLKFSARSQDLGQQSATKAHTMVNAHSCHWCMRRPSTENVNARRHGGLCGLLTRMCSAPSGGPLSIQRSRAAPVFILQSRLHECEPVGVRKCTLRDALGCISEKGEIHLNLWGRCLTDGDVFMHGHSKVAKHFREQLLPPALEWFLKKELQHF